MEQKDLTQEIVQEIEEQGEMDSSEIIQQFVDSDNSVYNVLSSVAEHENIEVEDVDTESGQTMYRKFTYVEG
jgi:transcription initiation factor IIE alpha subunit